MKFLRSRIVTKTIAVFFILNFLVSIFLPTYSYALTGGPNQIEYTSYEEPGATDMVNLVTGDFTYNLPILDVPGSEGSFSLPLSYHAGIAVDQEASWVGLGWTMNPGAIVRSINEFPDDASGETQSVTVQDLNVVKGWDSNLGLVKFGWNNRDGHYGSVSLFDIVSTSWNHGVKSVGIVGVTMSNEGVTFDALTFMSAVITIATWGAAAGATTAATKAAKVAAVAKTAAIDGATQFAMGAALGGSTPNAPTAGTWKYTKVKKQQFLHKEYKIWLNKTRVEEMYGILYLGAVTNYIPSVASDYGVSTKLTNGGVSETLDKFGNVSTYNKGSASDMNYHIDEGKEYWEVNNAAVLAYDDYQVFGNGVSGAISPYRLDVGSVAMPREMSSKHARLAPVKYQDYKVPFQYEGVPANSYFHHVGGATSVSTPTFYGGISHTVGNTNPVSNTSLTYLINDVTLKNERIRSDVATTKKLATGNHIEWLSNDEITSSVTYPSKFMDFLSASGSERYDFRKNFTLGSTSTPVSYDYSTSSFSNVITVPTNVYDMLLVNDAIIVTANFFPDAASHNLQEFGVFDMAQNVLVLSKYSSGGVKTITLSNDPIFTTHNGSEADVTLTYYKTPIVGKAIGGFVVTAQDGTNYHYALPIYDYDQRTEVIDAMYPKKRSIITRQQAFANTWLLTAITYSDFIDRNNNGLVDDGDWGGWIKLNYGKHSDQYKWRTPYGATNKKDPKDKTYNYSEGNKQLYYLNSIETRSHVALFLKSARTDALSMNTPAIAPLKLDEICLLNKTHYKKIIQQYGIPEFSNKINNVCLSSQFTGQSIRDFINKNCEKRVVFSYTTDLCPGTLNSTAPNAGKLTLSRISIKAKGSDTGIIPDYKFEYGYNPSYDINKWDGWGLYNPAGTTGGTTHKASQSDQDGAAWSLKKVTTPLGSTLEIDYERDAYSSISGNPAPSSSFSGTVDNHVKYVAVDYIDNVTDQSSFAVGDNVHITGSYSYPCSGQSSVDGTFDFSTSIQSISGNRITFWAPLFQPVCSSQSLINYTIYGNLDNISIGRKGGDIRVSSITSRDEFGLSNKIKYLYQNSDGNCSGVIGKSNPYAIATNFPFETLPEYPNTPVMYGSVSVLNGKLTDDNDYHTKTTYEFETPHYNLIVNNNYTEIPSTLIKFFIGWREFLTITRHTIENHTAKIGNLKSIKVYDKQNTLKSSSVMEYTSQIVNDAGNNYQGQYSEGTIMFDRIKQDVNYYHKVNKTTILRYAYVLKSVTNSKDGNTGKSENIKWDFITGSPLEKIETSPLGVKVKSVTVPAYKKHAELGAKAEYISNKNMLSQIAEEYSYLLDAAGAEVGLLSGGAQLWQKNWSTYRVYNSGTGLYADGAEGDLIWRKGPAYVWKGDYSRLRTDGSQTFSAADKYNFTSGPNNGWQYVGEPLRYDHYSMPLEGKNLNNIRSVSKMGYDNTIKLLGASNAEYNEVAFSSAEDLDGSIGYFGGEVALKNTSGNAVVVKKSGGADSHTGDCAISMSSGYGFVYKPTGLKTNKTYRASAWTNSINGRIYYKLNGGTEVLSPAPTIQTKAGNWYLINLEIATGSPLSSFEVGVKSNSGTVLFDDFRFQPVDASMVCYVYNPLDYEFTTTLSYSEYVLDNDNLFTRYLYNDKGMLYRTFKESIKYGGEKLISESNSDFRRLHVNQ